MGPTGPTGQVGVYGGYVFQMSTETSSAVDGTGNADCDAVAGSPCTATLTGGCSGNDKVQVGCDCVVVINSGSNTITDPVSLDWAIDKVLSGLTPTNTCTCKGTSVVGIAAEPAYMFAQAVCLKLVA